MISQSNKVNVLKWDEVLSEAGVQGTIFQTTYWAEFLSQFYGDRPRYYTAYGKKGDVEGQLLAFESCFAKHPMLTVVGMSGFLFGQIVRKSVAPVFHECLPFVYWEHGPVFSLNGKSGGVYRELLGGVVSRAQQLGCYSIKFARPAFFSDAASLYSSFGFGRQRMGTFLVSLDKPVEALWDSVDKHSRRNVRKVEGDVVVRQAVRPEELEEFYAVHVESSKRLGTKVFPFSFFVCLWNFFSPLGMAPFFVAYAKDKPVGAIMCLAYNRCVHEYFVADSLYARENRLNVNDVLKWTAIKWAKEKGFGYFDLSGVELHKIDAGDEKAKNIYRFKSKWGGELVEYHDYDLTFRSPKTMRVLSRYLSDSI